MMDKLRFLYAHTSDPAVAEQLATLAVRSLLPLAELAQHMVDTTGLTTTEVGKQLTARLDRIEVEAILEGVIFA